MRFDPAWLAAPDCPHWPCTREMQEPRELRGTTTARGDPSSGLGEPLPSQVLSTHSSPLCEGLNQDPCPAPSPILLLWTPLDKPLLLLSVRRWAAGLLPDSTGRYRMGDSE